MRTVVQFVMTVLLLLAFAGLCSSQEASNNQTSNAEESSVDGPIKRRAAIRAIADVAIKLHSSVDQEALDGLWKEVSTSLDSARRGYEADAAKNRALGWLSGRFRVDVPKFWAERFLNLQPDKHGSYLASFTPENMRANPKTERQVIRRGDSLLISSNDREFKLPVELVGSEEFQEGLYFSAMTEGDDVIVAPYRDSDLGGFPIVCINRQTGLIRWKAEVETGFFGGLGGLPPHQMVAILVKNDKVLAFTTGLEVSLDVFSLQNGAVLARSSSAYLWQVD